MSTQQEQDNGGKFRGTDADVLAVDSCTQIMLTVMQNNGWFLCGTRIWHPRFSAPTPYCHTTEFRKLYRPEDGAPMLIECIPVVIPNNSDYYLLSEAQSQRASICTAFNTAFSHDKRLGIKWDLPFNKVSPTPEEEFDAVCKTSIYEITIQTGGQQ